MHHYSEYMVCVLFQDNKLHILRRPPLVGGSPLENVLEDRKTMKYCLKLFERLGIAVLEEPVVFFCATPFGYE